MHPDEAAASLAFGNKLSEGLLGQAPQGQQPQAPQEAPQTPESAPGATKAPQEAQTPSPQEQAPQEAQENEQLAALTKDVAELKGNIEGVINSKFDALTKTITDALKE